MHVISNRYFNEMNPLLKGDGKGTSIFSVFMLIVLKLLVEAGGV